MAIKRTKKPVPKKSTILKSDNNREEVLSTPDTPLIFISHDSRDAELAEEFSTLLKKSCAGFIKSFISSDKKGTQGIPYGLEWYPVIMKKIEESTDVVCLLTPNSVNRPWILYEAGVAMGKKDKKVIGITLGISLDMANKGPFAQFQNNEGDKDSLIKLIYELSNKVQGLEPDRQIVENQVVDFIKKADEITSVTPNTNDDETTDISVAKLFEEVKIMFDDLPNRIENRIDPELNKRRRKFHPRMMEEIFEIGLINKNPDVGILMTLAFFRNDFPWIYDLGNETLKTIKSKKVISEKEDALRDFLNILDFTTHHPMMRDIINYNKEYHFLFRDTVHILEKLYSRLLKNTK